MAKKKVVITCAITGAIHTPTMSDALPYRTEDIVKQAVDAAEAGAAVLHLHARNPENGAVSLDPEHFMAFLPQIKQQTKAVINVSTGGSLQTTIDDRDGAGQARFAGNVFAQHGLNELLLPSACQSL